GDVEASLAAGHAVVVPVLRGAAPGGALLARRAVRLVEVAALLRREPARVQAAAAAVDLRGPAAVASELRLERAGFRVAALIHHRRPGLYGARRGGRLALGVGRVRVVDPRLRARDEVAAAVEGGAGPEEVGQAVVRHRGPARRRVPPVVPGHVCGAAQGADP